MNPHAASSARRAVSFAAATVLTAGLAAALVACGSDATADGDSSSAEPAGLEILIPGEGDTVSVPFRIAVESEYTLGGAEGDHHLHVWFGDNQTDFDVYESATAEITQAPIGATTMWVQVHTYDHRPASDPVSLPLTVTG